MLVEITIPTYNEEKIIKANLLALIRYLKSNADFNYRITIADNASKDKTREIVKSLAKKYSFVHLFATPRKGRGYALKQVWNKSRADLLCYMDADLSTELKHIKELVHALMQGNDIVSGNRLGKFSSTSRRAYRSFLSVSFNNLVKLLLNTMHSNDVQCGFKGIRKKAYNKISSRLTNNEWFFDTQLMVWGEKKGLKIKEIPIKWIEREASKVNVVKTVTDYLRDITKLRKELKNENIL